MGTRTHKPIDISRIKTKAIMQRVWDMMKIEGDITFPMAKEMNKRACLIIDNSILTLLQLCLAEGKFTRQDQATTTTTKLYNSNSHSL